MLSCERGTPVNPCVGVAVYLKSARMTSSLALARRPSSFRPCIGGKCVRFGPHNLIKSPRNLTHLTLYEETLSQHLTKRPYTEASASVHAL